jgi:DNA replication protein DnaC
MEAKAPHDMPNTFSNAILTGPAGVGKSTMIHAVMDAINGALFDNRSVFETQKL